jgi:DNA-directed RNA polymerase subunit RPC12/RpoP
MNDNCTLDYRCVRCDSAFLIAIMRPPSASPWQQTPLVCPMCGYAGLRLRKDDPKVTPK